MPRVGIEELLVILLGGSVILVIAILPFWMIFSKAGFSGWMSLTQLIPLVNVIALFYLAFAEWPVHGELERLKTSRI